MNNTATAPTAREWSTQDTSTATDLDGKVTKVVSDWHHRATNGGKTENPALDEGLTQALAKTIREGAERLRRDQEIPEEGKAGAITEAVSGAMVAIREHPKLATYAVSKVKELINNVDGELAKDPQLEKDRTPQMAQAAPPRESATARVTAAAEAPELATAGR